MLSHLLALPTVNIPVGDHVVRKVGGFKLNLDTIWTTAATVIIVLGMGLYLRRKSTSGVPGKLQMAWEFVVGSVGNQVEAALGPRYRRVVPVAVAIFFTVLVADWLELLPGLFRNTDYSPSPSADVNLTYALGITVFVLTNAAGIRAKGLGRHLKDFFNPLHFLEQVTRPFTLALRLFGNLFAGGIMIALLLSLSHVVFFIWASAAFSVVWKLFDMFIGAVQAFIFALLTILYYQFSTESHDAAH